MPNISILYRQLTIHQLAEADIASQARNTAGLVGQGIQSGVANAGTTFNRFVEGSDSGAYSRAPGREPEKKDFWDSFGAPPKGPSEDKKDFWDEFSSAGESRAQTVGASKKPSGIGTSAMKKPAKKEEDGWGDW